MHDMQTLTQLILENGLGSRIISRDQLARMLEGSPQRRYNLVNRALRKGELLQLQRGKYLLAPSTLLNSTPHPFVLAQALAPGSFISFESALCFHGWIPEAVPVTMSVVPGRRQLEINHPILGLYRMYPIAIQEGGLLESVERITFNGHAALVAMPLRALLDIICRRKLAPEEVRGFADAMRIDVEHLRNIAPEVWLSMARVYRHKRMALCITALREACKK